MKIPRPALTLWLTVGIVPSAAAQMTVSPAPSMHDTGTMPMMDNSMASYVVFDKMEGRVGGGQQGFHWDGQAWIGTDYDKLWLKSEGFLTRSGKVEDGRHELFYDRAISRNLDLQVGVRADLDSATPRTWAALGVQGTAPLFFDYEATAYLSDRGHAAARLTVSYDILITQRLILQPEIEANFYSKADPARGVGSGLADIDAGVRLRYEISRKFAPYIGVAYGGKFGETARMAQRAGESTNIVQFVFGIRGWF